MQEQGCGDPRQERRPQEGRRRADGGIRQDGDASAREPERAEPGILQAGHGGSHAAQVGLFEVAGAGVRLPARRLRADRLADAVRVARTRTEGARRIAAGYRAAGGAKAAADAVETRLLHVPAAT